MRGCAEPGAKAVMVVTRSLMQIPSFRSSIHLVSDSVSYEMTGTCKDSTFTAQSIVFAVIHFRIAQKSCIGAMNSAEETRLRFIT